MSRHLIVAVVSVVTALVLMGASTKEKQPVPKTDAHATVPMKRTMPPVQATPSVQQQVPEVQVDVPTADTRPTTAQAAAYQLNWYSINGGGTINASSTNYQMGLSIGQSVAGAASGTNYDMGIGFWYGASESETCPIVVAGDLNSSGTVTSSDIILLVNYVFKAGAVPQPCEANGDVNCSGAVTSADIIRLVNYVFKAGIPPCNTCTSPLAAAC